MRMHEGPEARRYLDAAAPGVRVVVVVVHGRRSIEVERAVRLEVYPVRIHVIGAPPSVDIVRDKL